MWLRLLKNVFPGSVRIRSVNLLGGRKQVVDACRLIRLMTAEGNYTLLMLTSICFVIGEG